MTLPLQATIVAFACFDLLAAVGLWLAAPWGGAIWLLCAVVEAASPFLGPRGASIAIGGAMLNVALVVGYFSFELARGARARLTTATGPKAPERFPAPPVSTGRRKLQASGFRPVKVNEVSDFNRYLPDG